MRILQLLTFLLLFLSLSQSAVITGACERDPQCGAGSCCAVSLWLRRLRMCTPQGREGDECHPYSHKVPFSGKRQHHTCPCFPDLICSKIPNGRFQCSVNYKTIDFQ
ncbi:prokineticin-1 [Callorhinchus milii]|nr:prokineticin-1 [Callorhinchus milii]|eukprot:gi/632962964/ref/XP_007897618.1/ PREDICTED: prokineticin-1 [Callorhinchus milii]